MTARANILARNAAIAELKRREAQEAEKLFDKSPKPLTPSEWDYFLRRCHPKQKAFLLDPCKRKALLCPRRTGKTTTLLFTTLILGRQHPGSDIAYVVPTSKQHAQRLFWKPLKKMNHVLDLGLEFLVAENKVVMPNGTHIIVFGAKDKASPATLRGNAWAAVFLDECKDFGPHFEELMIEAALPGLEDYDGTLILAGTPGSVLVGMFYNVTVKQPEGWSVHKWVKSDNPFLPNDARDLAIVECREYHPLGLTRDSPKFRREQLAEWCTDDTERVYFYDRKRNHWHGTCKDDLDPAHQWNYVLGLDLGERDANAFIVGAFALTDLRLHIVHQYARPRMSIDEIAAYTQSLIAYHGPFVAMVADTGGYGRGIVTDMADRHNLHFEPADKRGNKLGNIAQMNSDFLLGRIVANEDSDLAREWMRLTRKIRPSDHKVMLTHSDLGDAALYMWTASKHYAAQHVPDQPKPYSPQWWEQQEEKAFTDALRKKKSGQGFYGQAFSDSDQTFYSTYA